MKSRNFQISKISSTASITMLKLRYDPISNMDFIMEASISYSGIFHNKQEENTMLKIENEDMNLRLQRSEQILSRVKEELARYRSSSKKGPYIDFDEEEQLRKELEVCKLLALFSWHIQNLAYVHSNFCGYENQESECERIQLAQKLLSLCTSILKVCSSPLVLIFFIVCIQGLIFLCMDTSSGCWFKWADNQFKPPLSCRGRFMSTKEPYQFIGKWIGRFQTKGDFEHKLLKTLPDSITFSMLSRLPFTVQTTRWEDPALRSSATIFSPAFEDPWELPIFNHITVSHCLLITT